MAKTAKSKNRQPSTHSRAARRAASPSLDAPTAAKPSTLLSSRTRSTSPPTSDLSAPKPHVLAAQHSSGISKKSSSSKPLKRAQRLRQLKGMERAEENLDKLQLKVAKSLGREKKVRERRKGWEDINEGKKKKKAGGNAFGALGGEGGEDVVIGEGRKQRNWGEDEEMDGADAEGDNAAGGEVKAPESESVGLNVPPAAEDFDEAL